MTGKDRETNSALHHSEEVLGGGQFVLISVEDHSRFTRRMILIGLVATVVSILFYIPLYVQVGIWQLWGIWAGLVLGAICLVVAYRLVPRGDFDLVGYWVLGALLIIYVIGELMWSGAAVFQTIVVFSLLILAGGVIRPRKKYIWLIVALLYPVYVVLINHFEPLPRYPILSVAPAAQYVAVPLLLLVLIQLIRAFHIGTIRTRLLIGFVMLTFLSALFVGSVATVVGFRAGKKQVIAQLNTVADFKSVEIESWVGDMQSVLAGILPGQEALQLVDTLLSAEPQTSDYKSAHDRLLSRLQQTIGLAGSFEQIFMADRQGRVFLSTDPTLVGEIISDETYFQRGLAGPYVRPPLRSSLGEEALIVTRPLYDQHGKVIGVLAGVAKMDVLDGIMLEQIGLSGTRETYLVGRNYVMLTPSRFAEFFGKDLIHVRSQGAREAIEGHDPGSGLYKGYRSVHVVGVFRWLPDLQAALLVEQDHVEAFTPIYIMLGIDVGVALLSILLAVVASLLITRSIATPLADLSDVAAQVAAGDLSQRADVVRYDEIGALAHAFNSMTAQLRDVIDGLEQRVAERTHELELRAAYQDASAEIGQAASSILDAEQLIRQVVDLIRERFKLYYVGLFMVDESGEWAVLHAGTGEAGRAMVARGHRLRVGQGMIGWSIANAQARVALEAEADTVRRVTTELPDTRAEAALPLRSRGRVIGALTVQSDQPGTFDEAAVAVLQVMADQVAVALDNARLFTESQAALNAARAAYGEVSRESWGKLLATQPDLVYRGDARGVTKAVDVWRPEMEQALRSGETVYSSDPEANANALAVPIKVRGSVIGVLDTYKPVSAGDWTPDQVTLLETLVDQLGVALESARLYEEAQRRAARERLTSEITDRMRRAPDVEGIVQAAVDELFAVLGTSRAFVRLEVPASAQDAETR